MRDYGKVGCTFWSSPTIVPLSDDGKLLALYLLTCSHGTLVGAFRLPLGYVAEDLRWDPERVRQGFAELLANGFTHRCESTNWVWIRKFTKWNPPANPNVRKSAAKLAQAVPQDCTWRGQFLAECGPSLGIELNHSGTVPETVPEPIANQEQKQDQEQQQKQELKQVPKSRPDRSAEDAGTRLPAGWQLPEDWRRHCIEARPDLDPQAVAEAFRDHWLAQPGKDGRKSNWLATWRNWVRRERKRSDARSFDQQRVDQKRAEIAKWTGGLLGRRAPDNVVDMEAGDAQRRLG